MRVNRTPSIYTLLILQIGLSQARIEAPVSRLRRQTGASSGADTCVSNCVQSMAQTLDFLQRRAQRRPGHAAIVSAVDFKVETLDEMCSTYKTTQQCVDQCPDSDLRQMIQSTRQILDFLCIENFQELKQHLPCFQKSSAKLESKCDSECGSMWEHFNDKSGMDTILQNTNPEAFTETCRMLDCHASCMKGVVLEVCGDPNAASFMRRLLVESAEFLEKMVRRLGVESELWPKECQALKQAKNGGIAVTSGESEATGECLEDCIEALMMVVKSMESDLRAGFQRKFIDDLCSSHIYVQSCFDGCPQSLLRDLLKDSEKVLNFICVTNYDELISHLPCFQKSNIEVECAKCGQLFERVTLNSLLSGNVNGIDPEMTAKICSDLRCHSMCMEEVIDRSCGDRRAASFMRRFLEKSALFLGDTVKTLGLSPSMWPIECQELRDIANPIQIDPDSSQIKPIRPPGACLDEYPIECPLWAASGYCESHKLWMKPHCQGSCNCCGCSFADVFNEDYPDKCADRDPSCAAWAAGGHCNINRKYMEVFCREACSIC